MSVGEYEDVKAQLQRLCEEFAALKDAVGLRPVTVLALVLGIGYLFAHFSRK